MDEGRVYLDHAATTPIRPEALDAVVATLTGPFGNPSGGHAEARSARRALEDARDLVADLLDAAPGEVVFTSGGTEADNLALVGSWREECPEVVVGAFEHHAVLDTAHALTEATASPLYQVAVDEAGVIDLDHLASVLTQRTGVVSIMAVNNEVGTVQPIGEISRCVRRLAPQAVVHTDAVQAAPWLDLPGLVADVDLCSLSGHKFGGPKGIGVLVVQAGRSLRAQLRGGGQERERRSGTQHVAGAVAMARALASTVAERQQATARVSELRQRMIDQVVASVPDVVESGRGAPCVPGIVHLRVPGVEGEALVALADELGVALSAGAACSSGAVEPSHVLVAMGCDRREAASGIRISFSYATTAEEVDRAAAQVITAITRLRD